MSSPFLMYIFVKVVKTFVMKNPPTKKFGTNSDERESYFPTVFDDESKIDDDQTRKSSLHNCNNVTN